MADATEAPEETKKEEEVHYPNMSLAQEVFRYGQSPTPELEASIRATVAKGEMGPYYEHLCGTFGWAVDEALLAGMKEKNEAELKALQDQKEDAEKNQGDMEILDALRVAPRPPRNAPPLDALTEPLASSTGSTRSSSTRASAPRTRPSRRATRSGIGRRSARASGSTR